MIRPSLTGSRKTTTLSHHLDPATLMSYAAGALPEALSAVAASHIAQCPDCAKHVRRMEAIGASLFAATESAALVGQAPTLDVPRRPDQAARRPLSALETIDPSNVAWRRLGIGIWHAKVPLSPGAKGDLRLIKVAPGRQLPEHGHGGSELTLILDGAYTDEIGTFRAGDVADLDETVEHRPVADPDVGCVCLIAFESKARFSGFFPRLMQPLTGM